MAGWPDLLRENQLVLLDGAWGTQLQAQGLQSGDCPDSWNLTSPDKVRQVARSYVQAGSRIILTNTFGANRFRLAGHGLSSQVLQINQKGVELSKIEAGAKSFVFASVGPTGKLLMNEEVSEGDMRIAFDEQMQGLIAGKPDGIVIETMADLAEAKIALAAARQTRLPVVVCMVFDSGKDKDRTMMGATPEQVASELTKAGADAVGANCGQGIAGFVKVAERLHKATDRPIWIKANAGLPEMVDGKPVYKTSPAEFASFVPALKAAGVKFLGGCCGTSPEYIRALKEAL